MHIWQQFKKKNPHIQLNYCHLSVLCACDWKYYIHKPCLGQLRPYIFCMFHNLTKQLMKQPNIPEATLSQIYIKVSFICGFRIGTNQCHFSSVQTS